MRLKTTLEIPDVESSNLSVVSFQDMISQILADENEYFERQNALMVLLLLKVLHQLRLEVGLERPINLKVYVKPMEMTTYFRLAQVPLHLLRRITDGNLSISGMASRAAGHLKPWRRGRDS